MLSVCLIPPYYPEYELKPRSDHSLIVDLFKVLDTILCEPSENSAEGFPIWKVQTHTLQSIRLFNIVFYGSWDTKALNGGPELFLAFLT